MGLEQTESVAAEIELHIISAQDIWRDQALNAGKGLPSGAMYARFNSSSPSRRIAPDALRSRSRWRLPA